jgi:hypothetical protein
MEGLRLFALGTEIAEGGYALVGAIFISPSVGIAIFVVLNGTSLLSRSK